MACVVHPLVQGVGDPRVTRTTDAGASRRGPVRRHGPYQGRNVLADASRVTHHASRTRCVHRRRGELDVAADAEDVAGIVGEAEEGEELVFVGTVARAFNGPGVAQGLW
jgi:hypothetical protein